MSIGIAGQHVREGPVGLHRSGQGFFAPSAVPQSLG